MSDPIEQLWRYNNWANKMILSEFIKQADAVPATCLHLLSHIVNTQMIWLSRINGEQPTVGVWQDHSTLECERHHTISSQALQLKVKHYLEGGKHVVRYTNTKTISFETSLPDILLHIFNHGTYHRAQIASEMRRNGLEPLNTDYITFVRT